MELLKNNLVFIHSSSNGAIKGLFRGLVVGIVFASVVAYLRLVNFEMIGNDGNKDDFSNNSSLRPPENMVEFLHRKVRVLCFVVPMTEVSLKERGHMILETWTKKCQKFIFFTDMEYEPLKDHVVPLYERRNDWMRLRAAYAYIYKHHMDDFDWVVRALDHTYIIMENLRWFLYQFDPELPIIVGDRRVYEFNDYMKGTQAMSKNALLRLIENGTTNPDICNPNGSDMDKELSKCLENLNTVKINGIDSNGRGMFFSFRPDDFLFPTKEKADIDKGFFHKLSQGIENCCSDRVISIENIHATHLYYMEYFIHKVHVFGRHKIPEALPQKYSAEEILKL